MKKTVTVNMSGLMFFIDEDAYERLQVYLHKIQSTFRNQESGDEIIADIESRVAEIFNEKVKRETGVVNIGMVQDVIATMGEAEQFEDGDASTQKDSYSPPDSIAFKKPDRRFYRDMDSRVLGGVCAGIAAYFNIDVVFIRVIVVALTILTSGGVPLIYIILWVAIPPARTTAQKLHMRGVNITINTIEKTIRDEYEEVKTKFGRFKASSTYKKGQGFIDKIKRRDRTALILIVVIIGTALLFYRSNFSALIHVPGTVLTGFSHHAGSVFNRIVFPGAPVLALILLLIGLIFKPAFKIILYIIAFLLLGLLTLKVIFWLFGGFLLMC